MHETPIKVLSSHPPLKESVEISKLDEHTVVIQPRRNLFALDLKAIWEYRELLYFLVWRDLKVRYRQTIIGVGWVILQPLATMVMFTAVFGKYCSDPLRRLAISYFYLFSPAALDPLCQLFKSRES